MVVGNLERKNGVELVEVEADEKMDELEDLLRKSMNEIGFEIGSTEKEEKSNDENVVGETVFENGEGRIETMNVTILPGDAEFRVSERHGIIGKVLKVKISP